MRCPARSSHLSNREVFRKAKLPDVAALIESDMHRLQANVEAMGYGQGGLISAIATGLQDYTVNLLARVRVDPSQSPQGRPDAHELDESLNECRFCGKTFSTHCLRRSHEASQTQDYRSAKQTAKAVAEKHGHRHLKDPMRIKLGFTRAEEFIHMLWSKFARQIFSHASKFWGVDLLTCE